MKEENLLGFSQNPYAVLNFSTCLAYPTIAKGRLKTTSKFGVVSCGDVKVGRAENRRDSEFFVAWNIF